MPFSRLPIDSFFSILKLSTNRVTMPLFGNPWTVIPFTLNPSMRVPLTAGCTTMPFFCAPQGFRVTFRPCLGLLLAISRIPSLLMVRAFRSDAGPADRGLHDDAVLLRAPGLQGHLQTLLGLALGNQPDSVLADGQGI